MWANGLFEFIFKSEWYCSRALSFSLLDKYIFASALYGPVNCGLVSMALVKNCFAFSGLF